MWYDSYDWKLPVSTSPCPFQNRDLHDCKLPGFKISTAKGEVIVSPPQLTNDTPQLP